MTCREKGNSKTQIKSNGKLLNKVEKFQYVGSKIITDNAKFENKK